MNVDLSIYRARIGLHKYRLSKLKGFSCFSRFEFVTFLAMLLYQADDIEKNPSPDNSSYSATSSKSTFPVFQGNFFGYELQFSESFAQIRYYRT